MEAHLGVGDEPLDELCVGGRALDELDLLGDPVEVRGHAGRQVVEHDDAVAPADERIDEVRADEPGSTGDEDPGGGHGAQA